MRWMIRFVGAIFGLGLLAVFGARLYFAVPGSLEARLAKVERIAAEGVEAGRWPGMMWAVVAPGEVLATGAAGFADIEAGRAMTPDTVMPIGSISKVVTGLAGAQAMLDGDLDPAAPISEGLTVPFDPPDGAVRTFEQLATHTSGIADTDAGYEAVGYHYGDVAHPVGLDAFLGRYLGVDGDLFAPENFEAGPGEVYAYSNVAAGLAGQVVADAVGEDFAAYSLRVLEPLGMSGTWGHLGAEDPATLYERDEAGGFEAHPPYGLATWPDGQFNASAADLARLMAVMLGGGSLEGEEVLAPELVAEVMRPRLKDAPGMTGPGDWIGLFWVRDTLDLAPFSFQFEGHSGGDPGVITFMYRAEGQETAFVLMLNGEPDGTGDLIQLVRIAQLLSGETGLPF